MNPLGPVWRCGGWSEDVVVQPVEPGDHVVRTGSYRFGTEIGVWNLIRVR
ncbi:hypothetical protein GCM10022204_27110 [Microlunatus aurantiacus]|uniref:Uncharacterized protein n=1 Tax=Microlunatus aurantiacus TaxID=446786 RepID=A0ABP7DML3_9ACTN